MDNNWMDGAQGNLGSIPIYSNKWLPENTVLILSPPSGPLSDSKSLAIMVNVAMPAELTKDRFRFITWIIRAWGERVLQTSFRFVRRVTGK